MTDEKIKKCVKMMRQLVSDVQGAPYPGENFEPELYRIWYEHVQKVAVECFEYLDANFPIPKTDIGKKLDKFLSDSKKT